MEFKLYIPGVYVFSDQGPSLLKGNCIHSIIQICEAVMYLKDRQEEAERDLRYLTLFSSYCEHINIQYIK